MKKREKQTQAKINTNSLELFACYEQISLHGLQLQVPFYDYTCIYTLFRDTSAIYDLTFKGSYPMTCGYNAFIVSSTHSQAYGVASMNSAAMNSIIALLHDSGRTHWKGRRETLI